MHRKAPPVRIERCEGRRPGDVSHPGPGREAAGNLGDCRIRDAEEYELAVLAHGDAALAQASRNGRADAAGTDDLDTLEHSEAPVP